jgi:biopolymer transport protein TolR
MFGTAKGGQPARNFPCAESVQRAKEQLRMAMSLRGSLDRKAELNVTPLIDVLLVLLIIFMVITPSLSIGLDALVPQASNQKASPPADDIVISVLGDGNVHLNEETVAVADLSERLKAVFRIAPDRVVFVRGKKQLDFQEVADVIDIAKGAGLERVALVTH